MLVQLQIVAQEFLRFVIEATVNFQPYRGELLTLFQQLLHYLTKINIMVIKSLFHIDVGVSGYSYKRLVDNAVIFKNAVAVTQDNFLRKNKSEALLVGEDYHSGKASVCGDNAQLNGIFGLQMSDSIDILVFKEWERVTLIHHLRGDYGADFGIEERPEIVFFLRLER